jgi:hypothetical protein
MKKVFGLLSTTLLLTLSVSSCQAQTKVEAIDPAINLEKHDVKALAVIDAMSNALDSHEMVEFKITDSIDRLDEDGYLVQYTHHRTVTIQRPDRLHISTTGDLEKEEIFYNGKEVLISLPDENVYAKTETKPTIETMMAQMRREYGVRRPAMEFAITNLSSRIKEKADYSHYVGAHYVGRDLCDHLVFANDKVEFQLWVAREGEPLPRKMVVRYLDVGGNPCYTSTFDQWSFPQEIDLELFEFTPSDEVEQIPFVRPNQGKGGEK